jgi:hypothetical protein
MSGVGPTKIQKTKATCGFEIQKTKTAGDGELVRLDRIRGQTEQNRILGGGGGVPGHRAHQADYFRLGYDLSLVDLAEVVAAIRLRVQASGSQAWRRPR